MKISKWIVLILIAAGLPHARATLEFPNQKTTAEESLVGALLSMEVLPDDVQFTDEYEALLAEQGYIDLTSMVFAGETTPISNWIKELTGKDPGEAVERTLDLTARVVSVHTEEKQEEKREAGEDSRSRKRKGRAEKECSTKPFAGQASYYKGQPHSRNEYAAAHPCLPFGTKVRVTFNGKSIVVRIDDRGPFIRGRVIDINLKTARALGLTNHGVARVQCEVVS